VLDPDDRAMIRGFIVNKFRGNVQLFQEGMQTITQYTGWPAIGVVPWLRAVSRLPSEDGVALEDPVIRRSACSSVKIVVPQLSRIANFDEFDALRAEPDVELVFVAPGRPLPRDATLIVIPGTKATIADSEFMRAQGWDVDILAHVRHGGRVLGICGGYQMLGTSISDPDAVESLPRTVAGLGLLDVRTVMTGDKTLREVSGVLVGGMATPFEGYEMHVGSTTGPGVERPFLQFNNGVSDGAVSPDGLVAGCYVHGLFGGTAARKALLSSIGAQPSNRDHAAGVDAALDEIAGVLEGCLDIGRLAAIAGL
jgi:adenosylcobyric acid synthase